MNRRTAFLVVATLALAAIALTSHVAEAARQALITLNPSCGPIGARTGVTVTGQGFDPNVSVTIVYDSFTVTSTTSGSTGTISAKFTAPASGSASSHTVGAHEATGFGATATFTIPCPVATTTTTTSTTTTTIPRTTTTTTLPGVTTTTKPGPTTTTKPGDTTTTTAPADTTPSTDDTGQTTTTVTIPGGKGVRLDRPAAPPGGDANANGEGCDSGAPVNLSIDGDSVGHTVADAKGKFLASLVLPDLPVGRYTLTAKCGPTLTTDIDIVLASALGPPSGTLALLMFFLLIGFALVRRQIARDLDRKNDNKV